MISPELTRPINVPLRLILHHIWPLVYSVIKCVVNIRRKHSKIIFWCSICHQMSMFIFQYVSWIYRLASNLHSQNDISLDLIWACSFGECLNSSLLLLSEKSSKANLVSLWQRYLHYLLHGYSLQVIVQHFNNFYGGIRLAKKNPTIPYYFQMYWSVLYLMVFGVFKLL